MTKTTLSNDQLSYLQEQKRKRLKIHFFQCLILFVFLILWELGSSFHWINGFIFSSPSRIFLCFLQLCKDGVIFYHAGITLLETLFSFVMITLLSLLSAMFLWWFPTVEKILDPYFVILNSLPKSALAPILIVWLGNNIKTIIITAILIAVFGSILNLYHEFCHVDADRRMLIQTLGGTKRQELTLVVLPSCVPVFFSIMSINIGLSLVGVIIGEFLAAKAGLGYLILYSSQVFKMDWVLLSIVILCLIAIFLYALIHLLENKATSSTLGKS